MTREEIVDAARNYIGVQYQINGRSPIFGLDCWGFFQRVCHDLGLHAPQITAINYTRLLREVVKSIRGMGFEQGFYDVGDLLVRIHNNTIAGHVAILTENGIIHTTENGVQETEIQGHWLCFRFPGVI